ncbi:alanine/glycine:cation symporter family protein [Sodalis ligni]|uniref:AGCS family alanine or glycine:cation symporter n=1 Tax=Sodalis ligni TaxID=2697027 RepID=A0A4R1NHH6_9GAMM|nr:sodium:alanine symporter family protein [Sodalis ligni]TCL06459.1 AGCS family alanine or glycine:cation symporter [Sodalis ligni]
MAELFNFINDLIWNSVLIYLLIGTGLWFTLRSGFIQFRHFFHIFSILKGSNQADRAGISPFQALCTTLAARIGCGNLTGVVLALVVGGPGAIVWMWLAAFIGMATAFVESTLAQLYKVRDAQGNFRGGPAWYMEKGLGLRWMGILFSCFLLVGYGGVFNSVQAGAIAQSLQGAFGYKSYQIGLGLVALTALAIFGGVRIIARLSQWIVPAMALLYVILAGWTAAHNIGRLADVAELVFSSAFGLRQAAAGVAGYGISQAIFLGVQRGLFSNEAGMGSAPNIAAAATPWPPHPASQGYIQMLAVFIDTIVICSATAAIILTSGALDQATPPQPGFALIQQSIASVGGAWSTWFMVIIIFIFAFTSIIGNYAYAESSLRFFRRCPRGLIWLFRLLTLTMVMFGCLADMPVLWRLADMAMGLMTLTNLIALLLLSRIALMLARDYNSQRNIGKLPTFYAANFPAIADQLSPGIWDRPAAPK